MEADVSRAAGAGATEHVNTPISTRILGRTQLAVSVLGFGASPLGGMYGAADASEGKRAVHLAIDEGVNFFDVSPYYGVTLAEERLGNALAGRRHEVILSTKCGRYGVDVFDFSARRVRESIEASLRRLRTDSVDLLLAHDVEFGDVRQIIDETIPALRRLQHEGKTRFIGISGYPLATLRRIAEAVPIDCILSYCRSNLMVDDLDTQLMPLAAEKGIGVINASALHMGLLTAQGPPDWHPAPAEVRQAARRAAGLCRTRETDISELALRFCLGHPGVASTLVGMATPDEVRRNLRACRAAADPELVREVRNLLGPWFNYVWPSGRKENQDAVDAR